MPENDIPATNEEAPAKAPAPLTSEQIAEIVGKAIDGRIPGLQSAYDTKINALETQLRQSNMDEEEIEAEATQGLQTQLAASQAETAALIAAQKYPDAYPVFKDLNAADSSDAQLKIINDLLAAPASGVSDEKPVEAEAPAPVVDPNNPRTEQSLDPNGMDADKADQILEAYGDTWPGRE